MSKGSYKRKDLCYDNKRKTNDYKGGLYVDCDHNDRKQNADNFHCHTLFCCFHNTFPFFFLSVLPVCYWALMERNFRMLSSFRFARQKQKERAGKVPQSTAASEHTLLSQGCVQILCTDRFPTYARLCRYKHGNGGCFGFVPNFLKKPSRLRRVLRPTQFTTFRSVHICILTHGVR